MQWTAPKSPIESRTFRKLQLRLAASYFGVTAVILTAFVISTYQVVAYKLNQQQQEYLRSLATSSSEALDVINDEYETLQIQGAVSNERDNELIQSIHAKKKKYLQRSINGELQLSEPLHGLIAKPDEQDPLENTAYGTAQTVEWFNRRGILLVEEGILNIGSPLDINIPPEGVIQSDTHQLSYTLPVYLSGNTADESMLLGYVRATVSTKGYESALQNIRLALGLGVLLALGLTILCCNWLTAQALSPLAFNVNQLQQFTSDAAHELRTPLTVIKGAAQILAGKSSQDTASDDQKINLITDAAQQMSQLVDNLLLLIRLNAVGTQTKTAWSPVPIDEILEDLIQEFEIVALDKDIKLLCQPVPSVMVLGNASLLKSVFSNLLSNACRYTPPEGTVRLSAQAKMGHFLVQVSDTGIGIQEADLHKVFERFWRADQARAYYQSGSGLGLAIAKTIVNTHGGRLWVESAPGKGSTFSVQLPTVHSSR